MERMGLTVVNNIQLLGGANALTMFADEDELVTDAEGDIMILPCRRGTVLDMAMKGDFQVVHARVPLAQMFGYSTAIRSLTKGRASYSMETDQFELAPKNVRDAILAM